MFRVLKIFLEWAKLPPARTGYGPDVNKNYFSISYFQGEEYTVDGQDM